MPKEYLEAKEASTIEDQAPCLRDKVLIRLLRRLGCRVGEVLAIEERHIDFAGRTVRIEHEKKRHNLKCPECGARLAKSNKFCPECTAPVEKAIVKETEVHWKRKIPIDKDTLELVKDYIKQGGCTEVDGHKFLFHITRQWAYQIVRECAEKAGFLELINPINDKTHHVSPHKFRDAFAIDAMKKLPTMDDARLLQELLGHANIGTTMRYRKVAVGELQTFYEKLLVEAK